MTYHWNQICSPANVTFDSPDTCSTRSVKRLKGIFHDRFVVVCAAMSNNFAALKRSTIRYRPRKYSHDPVHDDHGEVL